MDFVMASSILGIVRDSAQMLLLGGSESLSLALWGIRTPGDGRQRQSHARTKASL